MSEEMLELPLPAGGVGRKAGLYLRRLYRDLRPCKGVARGRRRRHRGPGGGPRLPVCGISGLCQVINVAVLRLTTPAQSGPPKRAWEKVLEHRGEQHQPTR